MSCFWETSKDPGLIGGICKLCEVHIANREIVLDAPGLGGNDPECSSRLIPQVHDQNRVLGMCERNAVDHERESFVRAFRQERAHLRRCQAVEFRIADEIHVGPKLAHRLLDSRTDRVPRRWV